METGLAPWLSIKDATRAVAFYKDAFGAVERYLIDDGGAVIVAELAIGDAAFWVQQDGDAAPEAVDHRWVRMILSVADPDAVFRRAIAAGATEVYPVQEEHGWRIGRIQDPFGHHWEIGRRLD
jgi:PhnB protein